MSESEASVQYIVRFHSSEVQRASFSTRIASICAAMAETETNATSTDAGPGSGGTGSSGSNGNASKPAKVCVVAELWMDEACG